MPASALQYHARRWPLLVDTFASLFFWRARAETSGLGAKIGVGHCAEDFLAVDFKRVSYATQFIGSASALHEKPVESAPSAASWPQPAQSPSRQPPLIAKIHQRRQHILSSRPCTLGCTGGARSSSLSFVPHEALASFLPTQECGPVAHILPADGCTVRPATVVRILMPASAGHR